MVGGDIIVRSNSNAATDGSLDGLNRDITRAREITKNKETDTDIYISPAAVETVIDGVNCLHSLTKVEEKLAEIQGKETELTDYFADAEKAEAYLQEIAKHFFMESAHLSEEQAQALAEADPVNNMLAVKVEASLQKYGSPEAVPAEIRNNIGKEYLVDLIFSMIPKEKAAVTELLANCQIPAEGIIVDRPSAGGQNSFSINSAQLEKGISSLDFMIALSKSDGKNHPPSAHPSTIAGMAVATPGALVKGAWNGASYIGSGQVISDFGSLAKLLASGQETASGLGIKIVSGIGESIGNLLDKVKDAGDDHWKVGLIAGDTAGQYIGEGLGGATAVKTVWIVAKGTVKVAAGTKVAHAVEGASKGQGAANAGQKNGNSQGNISDTKGRSSALSRYDGSKPEYHINPAHVKGPQYNSNKTPLPKDAAEVYKNAVPDNPINAKNWYGISKDGSIYRFSSSNDGKIHFSGRSGVGDGIRNITPYAKKRLGIK